MLPQAQAQLLDGSFEAAGVEAGVGSNSWSYESGAVGSWTFSNSIGGPGISYGWSGSPWHPDSSNSAQSGNYFAFLQAAYPPAVATPRRLRGV